MRNANIQVKGLFSSLPQDFRAGLIVFLVALPLCLGIAAACKAPLMSGILAGAVGGIVVGLLGGSQLGVSGPAAGLLTVVVGGIATLGSFEALLLATILAGGMQVLLGLARLGTIAYYFPTAVIKGMLAAIGFIIVLKQLPHGLGYDLVPEGDLDFFQKDGHTTISELVYMFNTIEPGAVIITLIGLFTLILWEIPSIAKRAFFRIVPGPLLVVIFGILLQLLFHAWFPGIGLEGEHLVNLDASDKEAWFSFPDFTQIGNGKVWVVAMTIAAIASVESLLCAEATDKLDPQKRITPMNRELWAQGAANMVSGLIGGLPVTQVIVRSSANVQSGAKTRLSAIIHGLMIVFAVFLLSSVLNHIPFAALAAILFMVGYKLARPSLFKKMWHKGAAQFIPFIVTFVAILFSDLLIGIGIGMGIGIISILYSNFKVPYFFQVIQDKDGNREIRIVLSEVVSFLNKGNILSTLRMIPDGCTVVIDASRCISIDYDVEELIDDFIENAHTRGIKVEYIPQNVSSSQPFAQHKEILQQLKAQEHAPRAALNKETSKFPVV